MIRPIPFYEDGAVTLYCGRAEDIVPHLDQVDVTITDPPYAEKTHAGARTNPTQADGNTWEQGGNVPNALLDFASYSIEDLRAVFGTIGKHTRTWVISFFDYRHLIQLEDMPPAHLEFIRFGIWVASNKAPQFTGDRPGQGWEAVGIFHRIPRGRMRWNGGGNHAVWHVPKPHKNELLVPHRTPKPRKLLGRWIEQFSKPGMTVLDPFCGSGGTLAEAKRRGRRAIGIELRPEICAPLANALARIPAAEMKEQPESVSAKIVQARF